MGPRKHARNQRWEDAKLHVAWLSRLTGIAYRLLTEAEWEYAACAGSNSRYAWGDEPGIGNATATDAAALGYRKPSRSDRFGRAQLVCTTWKAMSGSGSKMFGTTVTKARRPTAQHGSRAVIQPTGSFEEVPGTMRPNSFKRHRKVQFDTLGFRVARTMTQWQ